MRLTRKIVIFGATIVILGIGAVHNGRVWRLSQKGGPHRQVEDSRLTVGTSSTRDIEDRPEESVPRSSQQLARVEPPRPIDDTNLSHEQAEASSAERKVLQLKRSLQWWPEKSIPELHLLSDEDWREAAGPTNSLKSEWDFGEGLDRALRTAKDRFAGLMREAMTNYAAANDGRLPSDISLLGPYFVSPIDSEILQRYRLVQSGQLLDVSPQEPIAVESVPSDAGSGAVYEIYIGYN